MVVSLLSFSLILIVPVNVNNAQIFPSLSVILKCKLSDCLGGIGSGAGAIFGFGEAVELATDA